MNLLFDLTLGRVKIFLWIFLLAVSSVSGLWAQFNQPGANPMQANNRNAFQPDSTLADSSRNLKDIQRQALFFQPASLRFQGIQASDSFKVGLDKIRFWDEADTLQGFVQSLGNLGKPVRRTRYGLTDPLFDPVAKGDDWSGQTDPYFLFDFSQLRYADTRTPFVNVNFAQASKKLQLLEVSITQNVTPWWNALVNYKRRLSDGAFFNSGTDHYNIYTTHTIRSRNSRYYLNLAGIFQQLADGINGGIGIDKAGDLEINPLNTNTELFRTRFLRTGKSLYFHQVYKFYQDSSQRNWKVGLFMEGERTARFRQFEDQAFQPGNSVYPRLIKDSLQMNEAWHTDLFYLKSGITLKVRNVYHEISTAFTETKMRTIASGSPQFNKWDTYYTGQFIYSEAQGFIRWRALHRSITFYPNALWGEVVACAPLPGLKRPIEALKDTIPGMPSAYWRPIRLLGHFSTGEVHPIMMEAFYYGNTFTPSLYTENQRVLLSKFGIDFRQMDKVKKKVQLKGNYFRLQVFYSRVQNFYGYQPNLSPLSSVDRYWERGGLELGFRVRLGRLYLEPEVVYQPQRVASLSGTSLNYYRDIPELYGRASMYYENELFRHAGLFRFGFDFYGFSNYNGLSYDPGSGLFYPGGQTITTPGMNSYFFPYLVPNYFRTDVFISARVSQATLFLKMLHVNQGLIFPQYYTTPYYPAWGRVFSFGVNWTFWD